MKNLPPLPAERTLRVISGRWKPVILYHLLSGPRRLSELGRLMPAVSQKVLIQQLREMEAHRIVSRTVFPQVPPRVDYEATALGQSLKPVLMALCEWGRRHAAELDEPEHVADCARLSLPE
ncbi:winged helix-turn-helix transcriptional regulator [Methylosinus sp. LW4]|uniref:winged helix-turn-helix transcriptional regulator n=1 Tax=Methylosinus sp. LW4 TaxID=136993 RepID=UPI001FD884B4|nr:helix-turn-helix domain-containing protein [Methylosinus sp. LW4]